MKPRKSWEPIYRFGGNKASWLMPAPLGTTDAWSTKMKGKSKKGKRK